jgi:N-acetylmuramic acid 6-phosphate etherase
MSDRRNTEQPGPSRNLEQRNTKELLALMNTEDATVATAVKRALPQLEKLTEAIREKMKDGGRLFYIGAGTSGRLAVLDAAELPPTFGVPEDLVIALIAGGEKALTHAVEGAEDHIDQGWKDLQAYAIDKEDILVGIAASGTTPYVLGALEAARTAGIETGCITNNAGTPIAAIAKFPVELLTGPEFITGSTRLKSGTAQKMALNMISTTVMIHLGRVEDNRMVHMQLTNEKLLDRGTRMILEKTNISDYTTARALLIKYGGVKNAIDAISNAAK